MFLVFLFGVDINDCALDKSIGDSSNNLSLLILVNYDLNFTWKVCAIWFKLKKYENFLLCFFLITLVILFKNNETI